MNYDQQNRFYNHALKIVEKMGGDISAHGKIQYYEYWVSKGFIPHSQASLENIDENKVLEIIEEEF